MNNMANVNVMSELEITKAALAVGWVKFSYRKADGTKRVAIGTTNRALIDQIRGYKMPEYRENKTYYANCGYFDLTRGDWRQFNPNRFIGLELQRLNNEQAVTFALTIAYGLGDITPLDLIRVREYSAILVGKVRVCEISEIVEREFDEHTCIDDDDTYEECERVVAIVTAKVTQTEKPKSNREELIAELLKLRQRESEILAELLK